MKMRLYEVFYETEDGESSMRVFATSPRSASDACYCEQADEHQEYRELYIIEREN